MNRCTKTNCAHAAALLMLRGVHIEDEIIEHIVDGEWDHVAAYSREYPRNTAYLKCDEHHITLRMETAYLVMCKLVEDNQFGNTQDE